MSNYDLKINNYNTIDLLKFVFSIFVVLIHTEFFMFLPDPIRWYINKIFLRIAVPFFFVINGFFLYDKITNAKDITFINLKQYNKRLIKIYSLYEGAYISLYIFKELILGNSISNLFIETFKTLIFYPIGALWYVWALILSIIIIIIINNYIDIKKYLWKIFFISFCLYIIGLLFNTYYFIISETSFKTIAMSYNNIFLTSRNVLFVGFPLIFLGLVTKWIIHNFRITKKFSIIIYIFSFFIYILELLLVKGLPHMDDNSMFLSFYILIPSLVIMASKNNIKNLKGNNLRYLSTFIYYHHFFLVMVISNIISNTISLTIIVLSLCMILYYFLNKIGILKKGLINTKMIFKFIRKNQI